MSHFPKNFLNLSPKKRELLEIMLKEEGVDSTSTGKIPRRTEAGPVPLSFAQERLWFFDRLAPNSPVYHIPVVMRLKGTLNAPALEWGLNEIVRRHESLRTTFAEEDGRPFQVVAPHATIALPIIDIQEISGPERETHALRLAREEVGRPFNLATGPLLRAKLLRLGEADHMLLFMMHHIIFEGWSIAILFQELTVFYGAFNNGKSAPLPELPIQYADFTVWQRQRVEGEALGQQLSYWKQKLGDTLPTLQLPTDRPRPAVQSLRGTFHSAKLPKNLMAALKTLSQQEGVTMFMLLLAAFKTLLFRYTGEDDILVGSPISHRNYTELEGLIGFFVNTVVLRTDLSNDPTFRELIHRVRKTALETYNHQDLPFELLVETLKPERDMSHTPLFQVLFDYPNDPMPTLALTGLDPAQIFSPLDIHNGATKTDLSMFIWEEPDGMIVGVEYNTDLFDTSTIVRMLESFSAMLQGIVANPDQHISTLPILSEAERQRLLVDWNDTSTDYPRDLCVHQLFEAQVERTPDNVAVIFEEEQLTYRELNYRANRLAHHLQDFNIGPESLVGIFLERSVEMVVGMLGTLKAGAAYIPLDPEHPKERLDFMLKDSQASVLLTQERLLPTMPNHEAKIICLDSDWKAISKQSKDNPYNNVTPGNMAYVIFTSGSTGKPKGAMITHSAICNRLCWMQDAYKLSGEDRVLQKTPYSFDVSVWELFWPILFGSTLVVAKPVGHKDSAYLVSLITEQRITTLHFVPPMLQTFLEEDSVEKCRCLKRVICSGEALSYELQERFFARFENVKLNNLYGPTEAAVDVTSWECKPDDDLRVVPIGKPISNTQLYVLDRHQQLVPVGVAGHLHIGGVQVARGYLNRPELTAEYFIPNPFSDDPVSRLYRTGDLARYMPDGNIEFLGRIDYQVKIRGFRIEPGEVEAVLGQHSDLSEAVVLVREDVPGEKRLVAYVVSNSGQAPSVEDLRRFLKEKLPEYMVPTAFVVMDVLPLTPNGKINRRALPVPKDIRPELEAVYTVPKTEIERTIAAIWKEVLDVDKAGVKDNFFDLGGHSLLVVQVRSKLKKAFSKDISMIDMFRYPTISLLAEYFSQEQNDQPSLQPSNDKAEARRELLERRRQRRQRARAATNQDE